MEESVKALSWSSVARDFNAAALWAGLTTFIWFASGMVPLQMAVSEQLGLDAAQSSSWIFIVWLSAAVSPIVLSLRYRQPIPITWTIPGLAYLGTLAGHFTFAELAGANLMAGLLIGALVAFAVAATPFSFAGITSAFWAVAAGFAVSVLAERGEMRAYWQGPK
jgi:predicted benzoate:H+ symporter BenE